MEAVCLASGPSLTPADVELVRAWRARGPDRIVIVANATFRAAPWADYLFGMDARFWRAYGEEVLRDFQGKRFGFWWDNDEAKKYSETLRGRKGFETHGNSGCGCLMLARLLGAKRIVMLGYDAQKTGGKAHWHADHPTGLGNASSVNAWKHQFKRLQRVMHGIQVINASRATALGMFPRVPLEQALG